MPNTIAHLRSGREISIIENQNGRYYDFRGALSSFHVTTNPTLYQPYTVTFGDLIDSLSYFPDGHTNEHQYKFINEAGLRVIASESIKQNNKNHNNKLNRLLGCDITKRINYI
jgi:hypothetical protein